MHRIFKYTCWWMGHSNCTSTLEFTSLDCYTLGIKFNNHISWSCAVIIGFYQAIKPYLIG